VGQVPGAVREEQRFGDTAGCGSAGFFVLLRMRMRMLLMLETQRRSSGVLLVASTSVGYRRHVEGLLSQLDNNTLLDTVYCMCVLLVLPLCLQYLVVEYKDGNDDHGRTNIIQYYCTSYSTVIATVVIIITVVVSSTHYNIPRTQ
jgi:hypothetical protein